MTTAAEHLEPTTCPRCPIGLELQRLTGDWAVHYSTPLQAHYSIVHPGIEVGR